MNRNLKRVLALALTMVVMAVNFMIPAMAATSITVSYTDLTSNTLTGQNGILFFDTSPGNSTPSTGLDTGNYYREYAPLEVQSTGNVNQKNALMMQASEWVRFTVNADTAGYYSVNMTCARNGAVNLIVRTNSTIIEKSFTPNNVMAATGNIGYLYLDAGENYVYVDNKSASAVFRFKDMTLTLDETVDASLVKLVAPVESAGGTDGLTVAVEYADDYPDKTSCNDGFNYMNVNGATLTSPVDIVADGKYKVSVMGLTESSSDITASIDSIEKSATATKTTTDLSKTVGTVETIYTVNTFSYTELGVFPLTAGNYTLTLDGFTNYSLAWAKIEYVAPYQTAMVNESFSDTDTVARGTDNLAIIFNDNMMETAEATLTVDGNEIPVAVEVDGATVTVSFLETLEYSTTYDLTVTGLQGMYDEEALADMTYTFSTDDDTSDAGTETVTITEVSSSRANATIKGTVYGSTGYGIKGRTVTVSDPDSNDVVTVTTGDNGEFTANFIITAAVAGAYTYTATSEYGATDSEVISYVSEVEELRILGLFLGATTPESVYSIFEDHGEVLLVPTYAADCATLANDDLFLAHFQQKTFTAVSEVAPFYNKMLKLEQMNQATTGSYIKSNFLNHPEVCELLGITSNKFALVSTNDQKTSFSDAIAADTRNNGPSTSEEAFLTRIADLLDAWLLNDNSITPTSLDLTGATTISVNYAGEIAIPLNFQDAQTKVKSIEVVLTTTDDNLFTNAQAVVEGATTDVVIDRDNNKATFTIDFEYDAAKVYDEVGKISLQASVIATHDITVAATVTYRLTSGEDYADMPISVAGGTVRATVSPAPQEQIRPTTGGGGYVAPPKEKPVEEEDSTKSEYFFDDMGDALWAQDMVHALVGKGVISQNSERAFRPMDNISREEVVKMLVTVVGSHNADAKSTLSDVDASHWATSYIATAQELGIVQGNADGTFGLGQQITRQDMAVMIYRTFAMLGIDLTAGSAEFSDAGEIAGYAKDAVSALEKIGIINGMGDNTFAPGANATRAQAAKVIYVMMEVLGV